MDHTGRSDFNQLWTSEAAQEQTLWLWREISRHYQDNPVIAGYDLLNEPWGGTEAQLKDLVLKLYETIRNEADQHLIVFPGYYSGIDFYEDDDLDRRTSVIYTMHFYPGFFGWGGPVQQVHADFLTNGLMEWKARMDRFKAPLLVGEFNVVAERAGGGEMMRRYYDRYAQWGWPTTMWVTKY